MRIATDQTTDSRTTFGVRSRGPFRSLIRTEAPSRLLCGGGPGLAARPFDSPAGSPLAPLRSLERMQGRASLPRRSAQ
jgi:hypothetical protein